MTEATYKNIGIEKFTQDDGAVWTAFSDKRNPDKRFLIVTSAGRELFLGGHDIPYNGLKRLFQSYRSAEDGGGHPAVRDFLGSGKQASVYGLSRFAVRETGGSVPFYPTLAALERMNKLSSIVEGGIPRWINVPRTYAIYSDPGYAGVGKQYTLMDRIDSGLTVEDIVDYDEVDDHSHKRVLKELGHRPTEQEADDVARLFDKAHNILNNVIMAHGYNPDDILTDWQTRNVIIEPVATPVGGERYLLNVIDQN